LGQFRAAGSGSSFQKRDAPMEFFYRTKRQAPPKALLGLRNLIRNKIAESEYYFADSEEECANGPSDETVVYKDPVTTSCDKREDGQNSVSLCVARPGRGVGVLGASLLDRVASGEGTSMLTQFIGKIAAKRQEQKAANSEGDKEKPVFKLYVGRCRVAWFPDF